MEIPVYEMTLSEEDKTKGHKILSLVSKPAMLINWVKFSENPEANVKFKIQDEEQRIIFGPVLIPDLPVIREENGIKYYLTIKPDTILKYAIRLAEERKSTTFDINHDQNIVNDVVMFEVVVTSKDRFPKAVGFEDLPIGTMFASTKINNPETWEKIKSGELNGYSIDANFSDFVPVEDMGEKEINAEIKNILATV